jgi:phosphohistidine phosphatase
MSLRLVLIRHAKSSWAEAGQRDLYRPLNDRGRRSARLIGHWLKEHGLRPGHALVSTATRTRETWDGITAETGPVPTALVPDLYESDTETMLAVLTSAPQVPVIAMLGHNPTIGAFARRLLAEAPDAADFARYPTAATAVIDFDAALWSEVGWASGRLADFVTPRQLEEA